MKAASTATIPTSMESLALPRELYWDGKSEPTSPPTSELFSVCESTENWLYNDNFANDITLINDDVFELKSGFQQTYGLINDEDYVIELCDLKEETWNDVKTQALSPPLIDFPIGSIISHPNSITKVQNPYDISGSATFGEGDNISSLDTAILTQLTPPHSPPRVFASPSAFHIAIVAPKEVKTERANAQQQAPAETAGNNFSFTSFTANWLNNINNGNNKHQENVAAALFSTATTAAATTTAAFQQHSSAEIAREMQIVDEIVKKRARELFDYDDIDGDAATGIVVDEEEEGLSQFSGSALSYADSASTTDDDWLPNGASSSYVPSSASSSPLRSSGSEDTNTGAASAAAIHCATASSGGTPKKRTRPYGRGVEDRKIRKKEQNKNAATRYRQKKKLEMEVVLTEEQELTQRNDELKRILLDRKRETKYLKNLIREFYQKK